MNWKLTQAASGEPRIDPWERSRQVYETPRISVLAYLALDPANGLEEVAPGMYWSVKGSQPPYTSLSGG